MKLIPQIKLNIGYTKADILHYITKNYNIKESEILSFEIVRESIDCRKKPDIFYSLNVAVEVTKNAQYKLKKLKDIQLDKLGLEYTDLNLKNIKRPVVVGFGPSGMFAGLVLSQSGLRPIIVEQGKSVDERQKDIDEFWNNRKLNINSNVQFGEGGAGTFSDGKLNSNLDNAYCKKVINELIINGAPQEIYYKSKPHIGSDNLPQVVKNIRQKIISMGGEVRFNTKLIDIILKDESIHSVILENVLTGEKQEIETDSLILCLGHSAIKTFEMLNNRGFMLEEKPFAMGVRIEQKQSEINKMQYGRTDDRLPSADYKLVEHLDNGRSVFTFCMCPGGQVVSSGSEENTIVTNGMSYYARNKENANSALLINVIIEDFKTDNVLAGLYFQREYEHKAFLAGGSDYTAPAESVASFLEKDNESEIKMMESSFKPAVRQTKLKTCLPDFVYNGLREGITKMQKKYNNFISDDNILIGIETRTSCPVRITRNDEFQSVRFSGIFPSGEGAGYAGGILSSAQDGIKAGEKVREYLQKFSESKEKNK